MYLLGKRVESQEGVVRLLRGKELFDVSLSMAVGGSIFAEPAVLNQSKSRLY